MGDSRIVEVEVDQHCKIISRTLVPNIMHATKESRVEGSRRYNALDLNAGGQRNRTFIDWITDTLLVRDEQTLQALFKPGNVRMLDSYPVTKIAIQDNNAMQLLDHLRHSGPLSRMEELYVVSSWREPLACSGLSHEMSSPETSPFSDC